MRGREADAARVNAIFDSFDVLITPVMGGTALPVRRWEGQGALRTVLGMSRFYPYCVPWNHLGNPAMAVPAGFAADGMPLSVQVIGRPGDEATLLSLAAQLEAERPWADKRPPICLAPATLGYEDLAHPHQLADLAAGADAAAQHRLDRARARPGRERPSRPSSSRR